MEEDCHNTVIEDISVSGFQKNGTDNVFVVDVSWSNGGESQVSRRYTDFVSFHRMLSRFPTESQDLVSFPSFQQLFGKLSSEDGEFLIPQLALLTDYCASLLAQFDDRLILPFFETSRYDVRLKRKHMMKFATSTSFLPEGLPQCMVISDYCHGQLEVMGGDYVTLFGKDGDDWAYVAADRQGTLLIGWIPIVYLVDIEGEDDPLIKDLRIYYDGLRQIQSSYMCLEPRRSSSSQASYCSSLSHSGGSGVESIDLLKTGTRFFHYSVSEDCYLVCPFSEDALLLYKRDRVVVVDKDADGWWYVCLMSGKEGWLPSTILEPRRVSLRKGEKDLDKIYYGSQALSTHIPCYVKKSYRADQTDELTVNVGEWVELLFESLSGWWTVRHGHSVGIVPGVHLLKQNENVSMTSEIGYSIGYNTSLMTEPPPRREKISRCASPLSPLFDTGSSLSSIEGFHYSVRRPSSTGEMKSSVDNQSYDIQNRRKSHSATTSPISPFDTYETATTDILDGSRSRAIQSPFLSMSEDSSFNYSPSVDVGSLNKKPGPDRFFVHTSSKGLTYTSITPEPRTKSPVPDRFLSSIRREELSISPLPNSERKSPIPERFFRNSASASPARGTMSNVTARNEYTSNPLSVSQSRLSPSPDYKPSVSSGADPMHKSSGENLHCSSPDHSVASEEEHKKSCPSTENYGQLHSIKMPKKDQNGGTESTEHCDRTEESQRLFPTEIVPSSLPDHLSDITEISFDLENEESQQNGAMKLELGSDMVTMPELEDVLLPLSPTEQRLTMRLMTFDISARVEECDTLEYPVFEQLEPLTSWSNFDLSRRARSAPPLDDAWYRTTVRTGTGSLTKHDEVNGSPRTPISDESLHECSLPRKSSIHPGGVDSGHSERSRSVTPPRTSQGRWRKGKKVNLRVKKDKSKNVSKQSATTTGSVGSSHGNKYEYIPEKETML